MVQLAEAPIKAYWQPGCTSCLRMKEFLTKHGVPFVSVNVLEDRTAMSELAELGVRTVPVIRRGMDWANGQVLRDVARVAGIRWGGAPILPPAELVGRLTIIQSAAQRYLRQIPDARLGDMLPNRPRSYSQLVYHIFNIADAFLEHEMQGLPLREGAYSRVQAPGSSKGQIAAYGQDVLERLGGWWDEAGNSTDYEANAKVYYGDVTLHDFLERTTWHSGQHVRQLMMVLDKLGIQPDDPVGKDVFAGLPMPDKVWDDEKPAA
jgi:glutaredoxin